MELGVVFVEDTDHQISHYHLTFDSGKKLLLSEEEGKEVEESLKLAKEEGVAMFILWLYSGG